jgi:hypothetical protein
MKTKEMTREKMQEFLEYRDGFLYWKVKPAKNVSIGDKAGGSIIYRDGRVVGRKGPTIEGWRVLLGRAVWIWHNGPIADELFVCPRNDDPVDTRIENLIVMERSEIQHVSDYAVAGVVRERGGQFYAQISKGRQGIDLGCFSSRLSAVEAYHEASRRLYPRLWEEGILPKTTIRSCPSVDRFAVFKDSIAVITKAGEPIAAFKGEGAHFRVEARLRSLGIDTTELKVADTNPIILSGEVAVYRVNSK